MIRDSYNAGFHFSAALTGRVSACSSTQGAALGYNLLALQAVYLLAKVEVSDINKNMKKPSSDVFGSSRQKHHFTMFR